jgi:hypothetical protein
MVIFLIVTPAFGGATFEGGESLSRYLRVLRGFCG